MSQTPMDKPITRQNLLATMQRMRSLVEPEGDIPEATPVDWSVPHRFSSDSMERLELFASKLAAHLEKCLDTVSGRPFEVVNDGLFERYARQLYNALLQDQPKAYYLPLTQGGKAQIGFVTLPFESAALLVGCMLRDPEAQIGQDGQMSSLAESILLDAATSLADALAEGFSEYGQTTLTKTDYLVLNDWPVRFCDLEDMCEFRFTATYEKMTLTLTLHILDEAIADIAQIEGPFGQKKEEKNQDSARVIRRMHEASMSVTALLSSALMTLNDILTLERGDVVVLDRKISEPMNVLINGQPCLGAWPATHSGRYALLAAEEKNL